MPRKRFLQILDIETDHVDSVRMEYDLEWLTILNNTNHLLSVKQSNNYMPGPNGKERFEFTPTDEELDEIRKKFADGLKIPENFTAIVKPYSPDGYHEQSQGHPKALINPQTSQFCELLQIDDPLVLAMSQSGLELNYSDTSFDVSNVSETNTTTVSSDGEFCTPLKRKSLSLPEPVGDQSLCNLDTSEDVVILEEIIHTAEETSTVSPPAPKLKRRNANIYQSSDE